MEGDTDREARLEEIEGRWKAVGGLEVMDDLSSGEWPRVAWTGHQSAVPAIAHAPEDIGWLLSEIDRLKAKLEGGDD